MTLPRPRFTVLRLMIVVAIVALAAAVLVRVATPWCDWSERRAAEFGELERYHGGVRWTWDWRVRQGPGSGQATAQVKSYHMAMAAKYEWAARYPWLPVWPDPPEPE
jgi:hypothetical protein